MKPTAMATGKDSSVDQCEPTGAFQGGKACPEEAIELKF